MHLDTFIPAALLILLATSISVILFKYLGLGSVLGLLAAGIAVGPHSPGPRIVENVEEILHFAELGIVLLLFLIGLEMRPNRFWAMRREAIVLVVLLAVFFVSWAMHEAKKTASSREPSNRACTRAWSVSGSTSSSRRTA